MMEIVRYSETLVSTKLYGGAFDNILTICMAGEQQLSQDYVEHLVQLFIHRYEIFIAVVLLLDYDTV
jgi:hypothetical protein